MNKLILKIIYGTKKVLGNEAGTYLFKTSKIIYIKQGLNKKFEVEVLIHEFIHFLEKQHKKHIRKMEENDVLKLGKKIAKMLYK